MVAVSKPVRVLLIRIRGLYDCYGGVFKIAKRLNYDFPCASAVENLTSATSTGGSPSMGMGSQKTKQISRKWLVMFDMLVGLLFIVGTPLAFYSYPVVNYNDIGIGVIFGLIILAAAFWDWRGMSKRNMAPYLILVLGIVSIFLFSYTFSTPWVGTYHLYIFPIDLGNSSTNAYYIPGYVSGAANPAEYNVQNYLSAISTMSGLILLISSLYEITLVRKMPKA
jgi:hypothetical protein